MSFKKIRGAIVLFLFIILIGGLIYTYLEDWNYLDSVYFTTVTVTTLGYGDFTPTTTIGKIFTIFFSLSGIAIGIYILTMLGKYMASEVNRKKNKKIIIKKGSKINLTKFNIDEEVKYLENKKTSYNGKIIEIGREYIKLKLINKDARVLHKKDQKVIQLNYKGKIINS
jgi:voltage-gated potassium channel